MGKVLSLNIKTILLAGNYIDRYLSVEQIQRAELQLLGIVCLFIACKVEEVGIPCVREMVKMTDFSYSNEDFISMEMSVLKVLEFKLQAVTSYCVLGLLSEIAEVSEKSVELAVYILIAASLDFSLVTYRPSEIAAGALYISFKLHKREEPWGNLVKFIRIPEENVYKIAETILSSVYRMHSKGADLYKPKGVELW